MQAHLRSGAVPLSKPRSSHPAHAAASAKPPADPHRIVAAEFLAGAGPGSSLPAPSHAEIAFAGRSNVGKSSLINTLLSRKSLVRTSSTPGSTRQINLYEARAADGAVFHLVDLPGYGFTHRSKGERTAWASLIEGYLGTRSTLAAVVILVDVRRGLEDDDRELIAFIDAATPPSRRPVQVVLVATKLDKEPRSARKTALRRLQEGGARKVLGFSSVTGEGREDLWRALRRAALGEPPPAADPGPEAAPVPEVVQTGGAEPGLVQPVGEPTGQSKRLTLTAQIPLHGRCMGGGENLSRAERDALDAAAMARILAGDDSGLSELYDRHAPLVFGVAVKILRDQNEAEDVVHDAFVAIVERADQFRPERGSLVAWLVTTVRNLALDRGRRRVRRSQITEEELRHEPVEPVPSPESLSWLEQRRAAVAAALDRISEAQRRTLEIAFFEGLTYPEIAEREGVPLGTVKSRAARALAALRAALGGDLQALDDDPRIRDLEP